MGKWVYVKENETTLKDLRAIHTQLLNASIKSKLDVNVTFGTKAGDEDDLKHTIDLTFFYKDTNFSMNFYLFRKLDDNKKALELAKQLMKDPTKFDQIKEKSKGI